MTAPVPARLLPVDGRAPWPTTLPPDTGLLAARLDADQLLRRAAAAPGPVVVDMDDVAGLAPDPAAARFLVARLHVAGLVTRHAAAATAAAAAGETATFLRVNALDSTGLERALAAHPRTAGLGTAISPGLVLPHLTPGQREALPRPILAYGLIRTLPDAHACRAAGAAAVVWALTPASESGYIRAERDGTEKERSPASARR